MNIEDLYEFCLTIKDAEATLPFDDVTLVMKVMGKMFAMIPLDSDRLCITLKCDPSRAMALREKYRCVEPAYHMNKTYWNCIYITGEMPDVPRLSSETCTPSTSQSKLPPLITY